MAEGGSCFPCLLDNNWLPCPPEHCALPYPWYALPLCALLCTGVCTVHLEHCSQDFPPPCTATPCALCSTVSQRLGSFIYTLCTCALPCPCSGHCIYVSVYLIQLPDWHSLHTFRHEILPRSCPECQSQTLIKFCEAE